MAQVHNIAREASLYPLFAEVPATLLRKKQGTATHTVAALIVRGTGMLGARARDVECPNKRAQCVSLGIQVVEEHRVRANEVRREVVIQGCKYKRKRYSNSWLFNGEFPWFCYLSAYSSTSLPALNCT